MNTSSNIASISPLLLVESLHKSFSLHGKKEAVLTNINLQVNPGEIVGLAGESGSGKSTLARCIIGLHSRDSGDVYFNNRLLPKQHSANSFKQQAHEMQMIFQDPLSSLNPRLTLEDSLTEPLRLNTALPAEDRRERAAEWLIKMGLRRSDLSRYPHSFSGGQLQRIGIARALITRPQLLICDEPVSALDVSVQAQIINLLLDLREECGLTLLFIGHDLSMMQYLCDRIIVMEKGRIKI